MEFCDVLTLKGVISDGSSSFDRRFAFVKQLNIIDGDYDVTLSTHNNVFVICCYVPYRNNWCAEVYDDIYSIELDSLSYKIYEALNNGTTQEQIKDLISLKDTVGVKVRDNYNSGYLPLIDIKYPDEEPGTIYNSGDGRFWNSKMQYVTNTGNLIS